MTSKKPAAKKATPVKKEHPASDPARRRYTEEELYEVIDKVWTKKKIADYKKAARSGALPPPVMEDFSGIRPQTVRMAQTIRAIFPDDFNGIGPSEWPPLNPDDGPTDEIYLGEDWLIQVSYDPWQPSEIAFINASCDGADSEEAAEYFGDDDSCKDFDSYTADFPLPDAQKEEFLDYLKRNFGRPPEKIVFDRSEDPDCS